MSDLVISKECLIRDVEICPNKVLGSGSYGVVYVAIYHGAKVAAKKLHSIFFDGVTPEENKGILQTWLNELKLMSSLRHPNIVQFYGVFNSDNSSSLVLSENSYIITELLAKSLQARNLEQPKLTIRQIIDIAMDISAGLCYLHNRPYPIMHRDLASKNILLSVSGQAKIADLGVAKLSVQVQQSHTRHPGTDYYMPLEAVISGDSYDHSIDVYALGVIILEMAIGKDPTATSTLRKVDDYFKVVPEAERRKNNLHELKISCNRVLEEVIMLCLQEKETRIAANVVMMHLEELKNSEIYQSCNPSYIFPVKGTTGNTSLEYQHKLKELQKENEVLQKENINLQKENEGLKGKLQAYDEKLTKLELQSNYKISQYEMQESNTTLKKAPQSLHVQSQIQQAQYVGPSRFMSQLPSQASAMVTPTATYRNPPSTMSLNSHLPLNFNHSTVYSGGSETLYSQPLSHMHGLDLPLTSLQYQRSFSSDSYTSDTVESPTLVYAQDRFKKDFLSLPAKPSVPTIQEATDYLNFQFSCIERVMLQLKSATSNISENLVTSFVETLKEQIIKTADYVRKLPINIKTNHYVHVSIQKIYQTISGTDFDKIHQTYMSDLYTVVRNFQDAVAIPHHYYYN